MERREKSRNTIVHMIDSLGRGGAEVLLKNTLSLLPCFHHVVMYLNKPDDLKPSFSPGVEFICLEHRNALQVFTTRRKIRSIIRKYQPLLVHSHLMASNLLARISVPPEVPLINSLHSIYSLDAFEKSWKGLLAERWTLRSRNHLVGVSKYVLNDYMSRVPFRGKSYVHYNFLPDPFFQQRVSPTGRETMRCVAIGNLKEAKNYTYLLEMMEGVKHLPIELDIYGEGGLYRQLEQMIQQKGLKVNLCGRADDVQQVLLQYDLFIQASDHEGFGLSVIEAMAVGLPVLLSDIAVFHEITAGHAHFFPLGNSEEAARQLVKLYSQPGLRWQFTDHAFEHVKSLYSEREYKRNLLRIYSEVAQQPLT